MICFEKRLYLPSAAVYRHDCLWRHVEVVGQKRYEFWLPVLLDVNVCNYSGDVVYTVFTEHHDLFTVFHQSLRILMHTVYKYLITEVFLHFGDIYNATVRQFLEFGIIDIGAVKERLSRCGCNGSEQA